MTSSTLSEEDQKWCETVQEKFEQHFVKCQNKCANFNRRRQEENESVDDFSIVLFCLAEHCKNMDLHDERVRDHIVVGIWDSRLSEKMQLDLNLTLDKATNLVRLSEAVKKQQAMVRGTELSVEAIKGLPKAEVMADQASHPSRRGPKFAQGVGEHHYMEKCRVPQRMRNQTD